MYCPESCRPTPVRVKTPLSTTCFHGNGARSLDQVMTGGGEPGGKTIEEKTEEAAWKVPPSGGFRGRSYRWPGTPS